MAEAKNVKTITNPVTKEALISTLHKLGVSGSQILEVHSFHSLAMVEGEKTKRWKRKENEEKRMGG